MKEKAETCFGESLSLADGKIILTDLGEEGIKILFKDGRPERLCESWAHHFGPPMMKLLFEWLGNTDVLRNKEVVHLRDMVDKLQADKKRLEALLYEKTLREQGR